MIRTLKMTKMQREMKKKLKNVQLDEQRGKNAFEDEVLDESELNQVIEELIIS